MSGWSFHNFSMLRHFTIGALQSSLQNLFRYGPLGSGIQITMTWKSWPRRYWTSFSYVGLILAALFFATSLSPSLLPRFYPVQGDSFRPRSHNRIWDRLPHRQAVAIP